MKKTAEKKLYEGMFLVDSSRAASDWDGVNAAIKRELDRAGAEIVSMNKWDDRKLAYNIRGTERGTYILCYFRADGQKIQGIEKAVQLSEKIIRVLILSTEQMTKEDIEKDTPATKAEKEKEKAASEKAEKAKKAQISEQSDEQKEPAAEESPGPEEAQKAEDTLTVEDIGQAGETEQVEAKKTPEETEKTEKSEQSEGVEAEEPQDSEPKVTLDE